MLLQCIYITERNAERVHSPKKSNFTFVVPTNQGLYTFFFTLQLNEHNKANYRLPYSTEDLRSVFGR